MKKPLLVILGIIFILVVFLVGWELFFTDDGLASTAWGGMGEVVNKFFANLFGMEVDMVNDFDSSDNDGGDGLNMGENPFGN